MPTGFKGERIQVGVYERKKGRKSGNLANLTRLRLTYNQLTELPPEIGNLANLTWLDLSDNPLPSDYPTDLPDLLAYLREQGE